MDEKQRGGDDRLAHPIKAICKKRGLTYLEFASEVMGARKGLSLNPQYVYQIARGVRFPSRKLADAIATAFPEISRESLMFPNRRTRENG